MRNFIKELQDKPPEVRTRILWVTTAVIGVLVFGVWTITFKNELKNLNPGTVLSADTTQQSAPHYLSVDSDQIQNGKLLLYFSARNDTSDILNFSNMSEIKLTVDGKDYTPSKITDLQNQNFVVKILSHAQNFGILTFDNPAGKTGQITFDDLYFEQSPQNLFKETLDIDLDKLGANPQTIRN